MESMLIDEFQRKTGCAFSDVASHYLQMSNWDVVEAVQAFIDTTKQLQRGISTAAENVNLIARVRNDLANSFESAPYLDLDNNVLEVPRYTFFLPNFANETEEFRTFVEKDLIESSTLISLEKAGRLNWWCDTLGNSSRLWPLITIGDGNCLLHAASLAMWGFQDRQLILRKALFRFLNSESSFSLKCRWRWQVNKANAETQLRYSEEEWEREWQQIINMASPIMSNGGIYESLEEIHILALAHVLHRAIIVISHTMLRDCNNEPFAPILFGGIYLPYACDPASCHKTPLILSYESGHFSPLLYMSIDFIDEMLFSLIPLVDQYGAVLPLRFLHDPGRFIDVAWSPTMNFSDYEPVEREKLALLRSYLDVIDLTPAGQSDNDSEEEIEKHFSETVENTEDDNNIFGNRNKAAKQLQNLGKQFGSIGKSMGKKLKKNLGSLTKLTAKPKKEGVTKSRMLCGQIQMKRDSIHAEMIKNYLSFAHKKYMMKTINTFEPRNSEEEMMKAQAIREGPVPCVNTGCLYFSSILTCYMCPACYNYHKKEAMGFSGESHFGTGKSRFYREPDQKNYEAVKAMPVSRSGLNNNRTLYLSKSTFYNDTPYWPKNECLKKNSPTCEDKKNVNMLPIKDSPTCETSKEDMLLSLKNLTIHDGKENMPMCLKDSPTCETKNNEKNAANTEEIWISDSGNEEKTELKLSANIKVDW